MDIGENPFQYAHGEHSIWILELLRYFYLWRLPLL